MPKVYSLGYAQVGAEQRLEALMQEPSMLLIDTRKWPYIKSGKGKDYWVKTWDRSALAEKYGERYHWAGEHLGNPNAFNGGPLALINPIRGINGLLYYLSRGSSLVLLCGCKQYERCHRSLIVQKLAIGLTTAHVAAEIVPETPRETLKCLSIRPPYAEWIALSAHFKRAELPPKTIENRRWKTDYRGPLLLHSSKTFEDEAIAYWNARISGLKDLVPQSKEGYDTAGKIIAIAQLVDVVQESDDPWFVHEPGNYGWILQDIRPLTQPVPYRGDVMLFDVPRSLIDPVLKPTQKGVYDVIAH